MSVDSLRGRRVVLSDGRLLGEVTDVQLDSSAWHVLTLVVAVEESILDEVHMDRPLVGTRTVPVSVSHVASVGDEIRLRRAIADLPELRRQSLQSDPPIPI